MKLAIIFVIVAAFIGTLIGILLTIDEAGAGWCVEQCGLTRQPQQVYTAPAPRASVCVQECRYVNGREVCVEICN